MNSKYTKEMLQEAVANSKSVAGVVRHLGLKLAGGTQSNIKRKIEQFEIDTSHFTGQGHNKGKTAINKKTCEQILVVLPERSHRPKVAQLRRAMIECGLEEQCTCGLGSEWMGQPLVLEVDHVNGNWLDNRIENLRFLCPNCHSQQDTNTPWKNASVA